MLGASFEESRLATLIGLGSGRDERLKGDALRLHDEYLVNNNK